MAAVLLTLIPVWPCAGRLDRRTAQCFSRVFAARFLRQHQCCIPSQDVGSPESVLLIASAASHVAYAIGFALSLWIGQRWEEHEPTRSCEFKAQDQHQTHKPLKIDGLAWLWGVTVVGALLVLELLVVAVPSILLLTTVALLIVAQLPSRCSLLSC